MTISNMDIANIVDRLAAIPVLLAQTTELLSETDIHTPPVQDAWSIAELIDVLRQLAPENWQRVGIHEERGLMTLFKMVKGWVEHEEEHYQQIATIVIR